MRSTNTILPIVESKGGERLSYLTMFYSLLVHNYNSSIEISFVGVKAKPITGIKAQHSSILPLAVKSSDDVSAPKIRR